MTSVKQRAFLLLITFIFMFPTVSFAKEITVELIWKFPEASWLELEVREGAYDVRYNQKSITLETGQSIKLGQSGLTEYIVKGNELEILENTILELSAKNSGIFRLREPDKDWVSYRGNLTITKEGMNWKLANTLDSEDYLKGVVPIEMSNAWAAKGFEALKAQAVAARTYLLKNLSNGRITDSPNVHQAYWGRTVEGEASRAVEVTGGEVLADINTKQLISVFYSSHNGGYSEETQNVWQNHDPHYASEPDYFSYGIGGFIDNWRFFISADLLGESFGLAPIREIIYKKLVSGRVYQVKLVDWLGNEKTVSGGQFVQKFYPYNRSISRDSLLGRLFVAEFIPPDKEIRNGLQIGYPKRIMPTTDQAITGPRLAFIRSSNDGLASQPGKFGVYAFYGRGWGHGVGMSQWGAYNMAMKGYSYKDILYHYYKNAVLIKS